MPNPLTPALKGPAYKLSTVDCRLLTVDCRLFLRLVSTEDAGVRRRRARLLLCGHLDEDFVQRRLDRFDARLREMGQIALRRRARQVELGDAGAKAFELCARLLDHRFLGVGRHLQRIHRALEASQLFAQGLERANLVVQLRLAGGNRDSQIGSTLVGGRQLRRHDRRSRVELS